jgi:hypothetical protein
MAREVEFNAVADKANVKISNGTGDINPPKVRPARRRVINIIRVSVNKISLAAIHDVADSHPPAALARGREVRTQSV